MTKARQIDPSQRILKSVQIKRYLHVMANSGLVEAEVKIGSRKLKLPSTNSQSLISDLSPNQSHELTMDQANAALAKLNTPNSVN
jgi:hypothetical protein